LKTLFLDLFVNLNIGLQSPVSQIIVITEIMHLLLLLLLLPLIDILLLIGVNVPWLFGEFNTSSLIHPPLLLHEILAGSFLLLDAGLATNDTHFHKDGQINEYTEGNHAHEH
jgi:hypothetical protein